MKELWNRSFDLFRKHFILWVPCTVAGILILAIGSLEKAEIRWLILHFATQHSALGGDVPVDPTLARHRAMIFVYSFGFLREFLEVLLYVFAFVATGQMVRMIVEKQGPDMIAALREASPRWRAILLLSFKYLLILGVIGGILVVLGSSPLTSDRFQQFFLSKAFVFLFALAGEGCLAWLLAPAAIRLLRTPGGLIISQRERTLVIIFAVATQAASAALDYLVGKGEARVFLYKHWEINAIAVVNTIIINAPQVLLFIGLAVLALGCATAIEYPPQTETESTSKPLPN
jgi:hypothetical protein